jgi:hypothetical protein
MRRRAIVPTESELRRLLQDGGTPGPLDAEAVIRRARARRLPKRIAVGAFGGLAVVAVVVPVALGAGSGGSMSASDSAGGSADESDALKSSEYADGAIASTIGAVAACGEAPAASPAEDLTLSMTPVAAASVPETIQAELTLANTGDTRLTGVATLSTFMVLRDGLVHGYANPESFDTALDLAPGETSVVALALDVFPCSAPLEEGEYQLAVDAPFSSTAGGAREEFTGIVGALSIG